MLSRLQVRNYILIDSLEVDFPEGLIIITGQTGAGKSILLGALSLLMGAKADAGVVSEGADNCVVEAEFTADTSDSYLREILEENDVEWDGGHLIVRRVVNRSGRSRAFVNDSPVAVTLLQEIASRLVDVHSQHQTLLLSDKRFQLDLLDHYAGNLQLRSQCADLWHELSSVRKEIRSLEDSISGMNAQKDYNQAQYDQLVAASLSEGELSRLEEEQKQLANADEIKSGLCAAEELLASSSGESWPVDALLKEAGKMLSKVGRYLPAASSLSDRLDSCRLELDDILSEVSNINSSTEISQDRLAAVEERMSLLYGLMHKHGCRTEQELILLRDRLADEFSDTAALEERLEDLRKRALQAEAALESAAGQLHLSRKEAQPVFQQIITESIRDLELPYAVFEAELLPAPISSSGKDTIAFRFSASGAAPVDVAKCASGGELSRIMLALKAFRAQYAQMPTMIFDEIDTGVSGSVADKMGSMICRMGEYMQVFAITHLPQVAAKGKAHYLVSKDIDPQTSAAVSKIERLSDEQRVLEVARMLSGSKLTDAAVANAISLLNG